MNTSNCVNYTQTIEAVHKISLSKIMPDEQQPRKFFDDAEEEKMANSIRQHGLLQPILLIPIINEIYDYKIVHGERRFRAHQRLGAKTIDAIIRCIDEEKVRDIQLIENMERSSLSDIEIAWEFKRRVEQGQTHAEIANVIGKNRSYVTQRMSLLKLSDSDQQRILHGELNFSQARNLLSIEDIELREKLSSQIDSKMPLKETKKIIREAKRHNSHVTRVTKKDINNTDLVKVRELVIIETLLRDDDSIREAVPRGELIRAFIKDIKHLRGGKVY